MGRDEIKKRPKEIFETNRNVRGTTQIAAAKERLPLSNSDKFYAVYGAVTERFYSRKTAFFLSAWELPQQDWDQRLAPFPDFSGAAFSGDLPPVRSPSSLLEILYRIRADLSRVSVKIIKKYAEGKSYTLFTKNSIKTFDICFILCYNISLQ